MIRKLLYLSVLLPFLCFAEEKEIIGPFGGLNNSENSAIIPGNMAQDLLNVDLTENGKSIKKRPGYGVAFTLSNATSPVHGIYDFYDSNGASVDLFFNGPNMSVSVSGGSPTVFFSTGTTDATYQCTDSAGFAYCANTSRNSIIKVNSSTYTLLSGFTSTGTMVTITPERLVQAGFSSNTSMVWFSKANDFSTWTVGGNPTDPIQFTITSPGSGVKHITYAHGRVYWFKDSSFGYILEGATQSNWKVVTINSFLGSLYNTSIFRDEILYFQANDGHFYAYDGSNLAQLSKDIQATIDQTQGRTSNSWTQTTQSDWQASSITPQGYLDTNLNPGSVVLSTSVALSPFVDTSSANFAAGTLTSLSTIYLDGAIQLSTGASQVRISSGVSSGTNLSKSCDAPYYTFSQQFKSTTNFVADQVRLQVCKNDTGALGNYSINLYSDNSGSIGTLLDSTTFAKTFIGSFCSISGYSTTTFELLGKVPLTSGQKYWIQLKPVGACDSADNLQVPYTTGANENLWGAGAGPTATTNITTHTIDGYQYRNSGDIVSRTFDNATTTTSWIWNWNNFYASGTIPSGTSLSWETQTSSDATNWSSLVSVATGSAPTSTVQRYIRYKGSFSTTNLSTSPVVTDVVVNVSSRIRPSGVLYSPVHNAPSLSAWDVFGVDSQANGGSNTYFVRSSTGVFYATATSPAWTLITPNSIPTISTNPYFQAASSFSVTTIAQNPIMHSFVFNWFEGAASDKTYAIYHDNANWWSVASGTGATTNNKILKFNLLNPSWYIYDIGTGGMLIRSQSLYFGSVSAGKIYKFGDTDNDDGTAITAYWKSKDFSGSSPFVDKDYKKMSSFFSAVTGSTATITYTIDGSSATSYNVDLGSATSSFVQRNVNLPLGKVGKSISYQIGNSNLSFEIFGAMIEYLSKSWVPK